MAKEKSMKNENFHKDWNNEKHESFTNKARKIKDNQLTKIFLLK